MTMRIVIFGIGAMGCLFGARLSEHYEVTLVGSWPEQLHTLQQHPLHIIAPNGDRAEIRVRATGDIAEIAPTDMALILTKAAKTEQAARLAAQILKPGGLVVTLQNGIGNLEVLRAYVGAQRATLGVTMQGAALDGPGVLRLGGTGPTTLATRSEIQEKITTLQACLVEAGFETHISENIDGLVWGKLAINAAINPLSALLQIANGKLLESEWSRAIMREAALEVQAVAAAQSIRLPFASAADESERVARLTALNRSSMLQDITRGTITEIEAICGAVVRKGQEVNTATPVNAMLHKLIKALEETR